MKTPILFLLFSCILANVQAQNNRQAFMLQETRALTFKPEVLLNTPYKEVNLCLVQGEQVLLFMSNRGGQAWSTLRDNKEFDGDIWLSKKQPNGEWGKPEVAKGISTYEGEDEPNMSGDGQMLYFQSWGGDWAGNGGPYYGLHLKNKVQKGLGGGITQFFKDKMMGISKETPVMDSVFKNGKWKKIKPKPKAPNNTYPTFTNDYATDGMTISPDGKIFIVAVGEYEGNMDLYISRQDATGTWSYLKRLNISTTGNERTPFLASDGKTLYFASDKYNSIGGLDIFKTTLYDNNECGDIYNLGEPINTKGNDCGFVTNLDNTTMLMIQNNDIISIKPVLPPLPNKEFPEINPKKD
ncbi:MAG: hypothetical protein EAZ95_09000 [Bacteroidetes bacterium]|nr:MAG: hypothetical protein EAZ95_09000 [Bacteroidota bacterium]